MKIFKTIGFALATALVLTPTAWAAPQILGLVATNAPVALICDAVACKAEFASICLQQDRDAPKRGQLYHAHRDHHLTLMGKANDGGSVIQTVGARVTARSIRGYTAVEVSLPRAVVDGAGARTGIALRVSSDAALIPASRVGDDDPLSAREIALVTGPLRRLAASMIKQNRMRTDAVQLLSKMLNSTSGEGRLAKSRREGLFDEVAAGDASIGVRGRARAKQIHGACVAATGAGEHFSIRECLAHGHDRLLRDLNLEYWKRSRPGS